MNFSLLININCRREKWWKSWHHDLMGWEKKGKGFLHFNICSFFFVFSFLVEITSYDWQSCCFTWKWRIDVRNYKYSRKWIDKCWIFFPKNYWWTQGELWGKYDKRSKNKQLLTTMEETAKVDDMDFFDQVLLN